MRELHLPQFPWGHEEGENIADGLRVEEGQGSGQLFGGDFVGRRGQEEEGSRVAFAGSGERTTSLSSVGCLVLLLRGLQSSLL